MAETELVNQDVPRGQRSADDVDLLQRREQVVRLRAQGKSFPQIASSVGVSIPVVQEDLRWVKQEWMRRILRNKSVWMAEALAEWESLIRQAWDDYCGVGEVVESTTKKGPTRRRKKKDPRLLAVISDAFKQKHAILGLGDKAAVDRVDEMLGKRQPKLLVVRDRAQLSELIDITQMVDLDIRGPKSYGDKLRKKPLAIEGQEEDPDSIANEVPDDSEA